MNTIELKNEKHAKREFARMKSVLACAAKDDSRYVITKVLVEKNEEGIAVTATDGRRMRKDCFNIEAEAGLYDIKVNSSKAVFLTQCQEDLTFPNCRQVIPRDSKDDAYALEGIGRQFVLRAAAGLGCWIDPKLVELGDDECVTLFLQKSDPSLGAVLVRNENTTFVVMPLRLEQPWIREVEAIQKERILEALRREEAAAIAA